MDNKKPKNQEKSQKNRKKRGEIDKKTQKKRN
mgnify:CR=1 FL=1